MNGNISLVLFQASVQLSKRRRVGFRAVDNAALITGAKWIGAVVAIIVISIVIYLGAVLSVYILAWILDLIGMIFD